MTEPTERGVASTTTDGHSVTFLTPEQQAQEDRRQSEQQGLKRSKPLRHFFRMFRVTARDIP
jgi:hypothetical protein